MGWFAGSAEGRGGVAVVAAQLPAAELRVGGVWSGPEVLSERQEYSNQNPVLHFDAKAERLHVFHSQQPDTGASAMTEEQEATVWHLSAGLNSSGLATGWSEPAEIFSRKGSFTKNRVLLGLDGSWLLPIYLVKSDGDVSVLKTLAKGADPKKATWGNIPFPSSKYRVQASIVRPKPAAAGLLAFFRDRKKENIYMARSEDDGQTWTEPSATDLPNNNAGIHALQLRSGRLSMIYNPTTSGRNVLQIALSEDSGRTWRYSRVLESDDTSSAKFDYPTMLEDVHQDGVIHISYSYFHQAIKYSRITEAWVMDSVGDAVV